jgi:hypothetical protein
MDFNNYRKESYIISNHIPMLLPQHIKLSQSQRDGDVTFLCYRPSRILRQVSGHWEPTPTLGTKDNIYESVKFKA